MTVTETDMNCEKLLKTMTWKIFHKFFLFFRVVVVVCRFMKYGAFYNKEGEGKYDMEHK